MQKMVINSSKAPKALGPKDDIVRFEYIKKNSKEIGPALIGVQIEKKDDFQRLLKRMEKIRN